MNIDLAREVAKAAFRSSRELGTLVPILKRKLDAKEYESYSKAVASAIAAIQVGIINRLVADHPGLEAEIERSIIKSGRYS